MTVYFEFEDRGYTIPKEALYTGGYVRLPDGRFLSMNIGESLPPKLRWVSLVNEEGFVPPEQYTSVANEVDR